MKEMSWYLCWDRSLWSALPRQHLRNHYSKFIAFIIPWNFQWHCSGLQPGAVLPCPLWQPVLVAVSIAATGAQTSGVVGRGGGSSTFQRWQGDVVPLLGFPGHHLPHQERRWEAAEAPLVHFEVHKMALCVAHFFPAHALLFLLRGAYKCVIAPWWAAALLVCRWQWGTWLAGQGTGFGAAAVPGKALGVTRCGSSCCLFLCLSGVCFGCMSF